MLNTNYSNKAVYKYTKLNGVVPDELLGSTDALSKLVHLVRMGNMRPDGSFLTEDEALNLIDKEVEETKHSIEYMQLELLSELEDAGFFILKDTEEEGLAELMKKSAVVNETMALKMRADMMRELNTNPQELIMGMMKMLMTEGVVS